jgi:hypothetical protein
VSIYSCVDLVEPIPGEVRDLQASRRRRRGIGVKDIATPMQTGLHGSRLRERYKTSSFQRII